MPRRRDDPTERRHVTVVVVTAATVGVVTGVLVAAFDHLGREVLFDAVLGLPLAGAAAFPLLGLAVAVGITRRAGGGDSATSEAYVRAYHGKGGALHLRHLPAKLAASLATLGSGGSMGYEGPAILIGGTVGSAGERRVTSRIRRDDAKVLMVAGAAAGVAAVFKAPLTGVVFALEVPYRQDVARRALLPALIAASTSYLSFVALMGTEPVLPVEGAAPFDLRELAGGVAVGVLCGVLARLGAWSVAKAKTIPLSPWLRVALAGAVLFGLALATHALYDAPLSLGSGYEAITWAREHDDALGLLALLFVLRFAATWATVAGGGVGGLFIPLVAQGALAGAVVQAVVDAPNAGLFPTVGIAAFLGGGYRTPLAGAAFVAEATGQPSFVVPALLASAASQLAMGRWSFSFYQRGERRPDLRPLTRMRLGEIMTGDPDTVRADEPLDAAVARLMTRNRRWAPVFDDGHYAGLLALADVAAVQPDDWPRRLVRDVARDVVPSSVFDSVAATGERLRSEGIEAVAVRDLDGRIVGVVTIRDIADIERLLDRLAPDDNER